MRGPGNRIGDRFPYKIHMKRYSDEYWSCEEWCKHQDLQYLVDFIYWRDHLRFKDDGLATMCKLVASVAQ
jgi:hypothetical protein